MTDEEFIALAPPQALEAVYATTDEAERARLRLLYAQNRGMLVDGSGASLAPTYHRVGRSINGPLSPHRGSVDGGKVVSRTLQFLTRRGLLIALVSLLVVGGSQSGLAWLMDKATRANPGAWWAGGGGIFLLTQLLEVTVSVAQTLVTGWAALVLVGDSRPAQPTPSASAATVLLLAAGAVVQSVGVTLGTFLFIAPGLMLAMAWAVWAPALTIERLPLLQAFDRSLQLTRGSRWTIFGLALAVGVAFAIINLVATLAVTAGASLIAATASWQSRYIVFPVATGLEHTVLACGVAALYLELVTLREGAASGQIAEIFG